MARVFDLTVLNFLWLAASLPIVTAGAATAALCDVTGRMVRGEEVPVLRGFFGAFARHWKRSSAVWLISLGAVLWLSFGVYVCQDLASPVLRLAVVPEAAMLLICLLGLVYLFPVCVQYPGGVMQTLKRAVYLGLAYLPWSVALALIPAAAVAVTLLFPQALILTLMFWIFLGAGGISWAQAHILRRLFDRLAAQKSPI